MKYYITDTVFIEDNIYYYEKCDKIKKIKENDWHIYLNEYGWNKLNIQWIKILNRLSFDKKKNSGYGILDCGGDGNCLFNCINYAINGVESISGIDNFRIPFSESISLNDFNTIIEIYRISQSCGEFKENWDPFTITFNDFKKKIREGGDEYWGDFLILNLIKNYLNINFVILYSNDLTGEYYNYPIFYDYDKDLQTIILFYENDKHFKLVGYFRNNKMSFIFNRNTVPNEILSIIKEIR